MKKKTICAQTIVSTSRYIKRFGDKSLMSKKNCSRLRLKIILVNYRRCELISHYVLKIKFRLCKGITWMPNASVSMFKRMTKVQSFIVWHTAKFPARTSKNFLKLPKLYRSKPQFISVAQLFSINYLHTTIFISHKRQCPERRFSVLL